MTRKLLPRRWALCLVGSVLFLGLMGGVAWRWGVPWIMEVKLATLLEDRGIEEVQFQVASPRLGELKLRELRLAEPSRWHLEIPEMTVHASLEELRQGTVPRLSVPEARWVVNLEGFSGSDGWMSLDEDSPTPQEGGERFPVEALEIDRLFVELQMGGETLVWSGPLRLSHGDHVTIEHQADEGDGRFTGKALFGAGWDLAEMQLAGQWLRPEQLASLVAVTRASFASGWTLPSDQGLSFQASKAPGGTWRGAAQVSALTVEAEGSKTTLHDVTVEASQRPKEVARIVAKAHVEEWIRRQWNGRGGALEWEAVLGKGDDWSHQGQITQMSLQREDLLVAELSGTLSAHGPDNLWTGKWAITEAAVDGRMVEPFSVRSESADGGAFPWNFTVPEIRFAQGSPARLSNLSVQVTGDGIEGSAAHFMDYGRGERYGPVPVKLSGHALTRGSWEVKLQAETQADQPWQAYWKGLGFAVNGRVIADGALPSNKWAFHAAFPAVDLRRNESVVSSRDVQATGSVDLGAGKWAVAFEGISQDQWFDGDLAAAPGDDGGRVLSYEIRDLQLPENTLLGAFAEALVEVPVAVTLGGSGKLSFPQGGLDDPEHRLSLHLRDGIYRHLRKNQEGKGLSGMFVVEGFDPFVTMEDQPVDFDEWRLGDLRLTNGRFRYQLGPKGAVLIREAEAEGLGGQLTMESLAYHPGHPKFESAVTFKGVRLETLGALVPGLKGKVGGEVSGKVHLRFKDGLLSLPRGSLTMAEGSRGFLRIDAQETLGAQLADLADDPNALQIVESALKDLLVDEFEVGFFDPEEHDSVCRIRLKGRSRKEVPIPQTNGGTAVAPIHLNINVDDPSEWVRRLLDFGLRQRLQPGE